MTRKSSRPFWLGEDKRGWDHVRLHVQLFKDDRLGAHEISVYGGLAIHAELGTGEARPAKDTLGCYTGLSTRAVYNALQKLERLRYIDIIRREGMASTYCLLVPPTLAPGAEVADADPGTTFQGVRHEVPGGLAPGADELQPVTRTNNKKNHSGRKTQMPEAWRPKEKTLEKARETHPTVDVDHEIEQFIHHHLAVGSKFVNWDSAFSKWIGNAAKYQREREARNGSNGHAPYQNPPDPEGYKEGVLR